jgi:uncharacterized OB-fold protein
VTNTPQRPLPILSNDTRAFWTGGARRQLLIEECDRCAYLIHPPTGYCPKCESRDTHFAAVSGEGFVESFSINYRQWMPGLPERYVVALIRLREQEDVRLPTNIVNCAPENVTFDMPVKVLFEQAEDIWVPLFEPAS